MANETFFAEITDTFAGDANYSWVKRFKVSASSMRGAVQKLARETGINWRCSADYGDQKRYDSIGSCTCFFIEAFDEEKHGMETRVETI